MAGRIRRRFSTTTKPNNEDPACRERLGSFHVYEKIKFVGLFDRKIARLTI
jgi:hypothetical protein